MSAANETVDPKTVIEDAAFPPRNERGVVKPLLLSHGTTECCDMRATRRFYEEFLGLECVRHAPTAMAVRCGMKWHIVCLEAGVKSDYSNVHTHWGLDVRTQEEVDAAWKAAHAMADKYGIGQITEPLWNHGVYSFYLEDLDRNWWEIQYYPDFQHDDMFDFGDRFPMDGEPGQPR